MGGAPPVSVVVPCHNSASFVADAVRSAVAQGEAVREIVLVDDGSTDATLDVLRRLADEANAARPGLVRVLAQANGGAPSARNAGLAACSGDYVQFLDADDVLGEGKLEGQLAEARDGPDLVVGGWTKETANWDNGERPLLARDEDVWVALIEGRLGITSANLFRRAAVEGVGGWDVDQKSSQEYDLMFRMLRAGARVAVAPDPLTRVRERAGSVWTRRPDASLRRWVELRARIADHLRATDRMTPARQAAVDLSVARTLQKVYASDPGFAVRTHDRYVSAAFDPALLRQGPAYQWAYASVGFGAAERYRLLKQRLRSLLPSGRPAP